MRLSHASGGNLENKKHGVRVDTILKFRDIIQKSTTEQRLKAAFVVVSFITYCVCFGLISDLYVPDASGYNIRKQLFGDDFLNMWASSKLLLQGNIQDIFNPELYNQQLKFLTSHPDYPLHLFSYPPHLLLFTSGLGIFSYFQALMIWSFLGIISLALLLRCLHVKWSWGVVLMTSPVVIANLIMGQNGLFTGVLLYAGLALSSKRPVLAGIFFALLTIKPQLGVLIPLVLIVTRNWKCFLSATMGTMSLIGISIGILGWEAWHGYFFETLAFQKRYLLESTGVSTYYQFMMPGIYANSFLIVEPLKTMFVVLHTVIAVPVLYKTLQTVKNDKALTEKTILGICIASALISPYFFNYDMMAIMLALMLYMIQLSRSITHQADSLSGLFLLLLWSLPLTTLVMRGHFEHDLTATVSDFFLLPSFVIAGCFYLLFFKSRKLTT